MTTFSISLPDALAKASQETAKQLGLSRTEFIRRAIIHELKELQLKMEKEAMVKSFLAMKTNKDYLNESNEIIESWDSVLPKDKEEWWSKKY